MARVAYQSQSNRSELANELCMARLLGSVKQHKLSVRTKFKWQPIYKYTHTHTHTYSTFQHPDQKLTRKYNFLLISHQTLFIPFDDNNNNNDTHILANANGFCVLLMTEKQTFCFAFGIFCQLPNFSDKFSTKNRQKCDGGKSVEKISFVYQKIHVNEGFRTDQKLKKQQKNV